MNRRDILLSAASFAAAPRIPAESEPFVLDLKRMPGIGYGDSFRVDPFVDAASALQALGRKEAIRQLRVEGIRLDLEASFHPGQSENLIVLCRMLFTPPRGKFRPPALGAPRFLGGTGYPDWPLAPIELAHGVPFLITRGYELTGRPEWGWEYLAACLKACRWGPALYHPLSAAEKRTALDALLASPKWKRPPETSERDFLGGQCF